jgi:choline dehydrogenase-like flavoprotein
VRLSLAPERQREEAVLAAHAHVAWSPPPGAVAARRLRERSLTTRQRAAALGEVASGLPGLAAAGARRARGLSSAPRSGEMWLEVSCEQAPDPDSRVFLGEGKDALGMPEAVVDWRIGERERKTMRAMVDAVAAEFLRLDLARVEPAPWLDEAKNWSAQVSDAFHHMGTTRMSPDPADGVVDADCRVHGVDNLFVAGTSVFPTSGASNPTLTAVALAMRLADHLETATG